MTAAFALGVYVGEHGWTRSGLPHQPGGQTPPDRNQIPPNGGQDSPRGQPPQNPDGDAPQGQRPPNGLPPGRPQIIGRLREIKPEILELATQEGLRVISIAPETRYLDEKGKLLIADDLNKGDILGLFGHIIPKDGGEFRADIVIRLPPKP